MPHVIGFDDEPFNSRMSSGIKPFKANDIEVCKPVLRVPRSLPSYLPEQVSLRCLIHPLTHRYNDKLLISRTSTSKFLFKLAIKQGVFVPLWFILNFIKSINIVRP